MRVVVPLASIPRFAALSDVPTIGGTVDGYEANSWAGVGVPRGTPTEIIERLNHEINAGLVNPLVKALHPISLFSFLNKFSANA